VHFPLYRWIAIGFDVLVLGYALWRGGKPERIAAVTMVVMIVTSRFVEDLRFLPGPQWGLAIVDFAFVGLLLWMTVHYKRSWTMVTAGLQLTIIAAHIVLVLKPDIDRWVYIALLNMLGYGVIGTIGWGAWRQARLSRSGGAHVDGQG
jgi:hypothetical protein